MDANRLAAFSDGVIAVIITIMVLELHPPAGTDLAALKDSLPTFLSYVLSFVSVAIYWNNHHHLLATVTRIRGSILWANMHLLFWLSLIPFTTAWMERNYLAALPTAAYGVSLLMPALAWTLLQSTIVSAHGEDSVLARSLGRDLKGKISAFLYLAGILLCFVHPWIGDALYATVACLWLVPDRRIERNFEED